MAQIESIADAEAEANRRFTERAEDFRANLEEAFFEALPGNHSPAEAILLAHLMTAKDGYNDVSLIGCWERRPKSGWHTSVAFLAEVDRHLVVPFALESRDGDNCRQLAVLIDWDRPGERLPHKRDREQALQARGWRVVVFTELEILANAEACRERVEDVLYDMAEQVLADSGVLPAR